MMFLIKDSDYIFTGTLPLVKKQGKNTGDNNDYNIINRIEAKISYKDWCKSKNRICSENL